MTLFSDRGVPMLSMHEKLVALAHCMARDLYEDSAGHLCDLLEHCRKHIHPSARPPFANLQEMVLFYGEYPTPLDEKPT